MLESTNTTEGRGRTEEQYDAVYFHLSHRRSLLGSGQVSLACEIWTEGSMRENPNWLHPRYSELVALFDAQIHELILRPSSTDFTLEVVQSLLLSIQWPALEWSTNEHGSPGMKSRFNDAYAWVMVGLAMRFAKHVNLDKCHEETLSDENAMSRMRIWLNLISIDRQ